MSFKSSRHVLIQSPHFRQICEKKIYANGQISLRDVKSFCPIPSEAEQLLETAVTRLGFSARAYDRVLKVARTIADLAGEAGIDGISPARVSEAIQYGMMDRYR